MRDFHLPGRSAVYAASGLAATSHPVATRVAVEMLRNGGNALDAAIAAALTLNVCEPHMCGLGGDAFALVKPAGEERVVGLNGSGRSPGALSAGSLRAAGYQKMPLRAVEAVTLPGAVDAFCRLSADWGRMPLSEVLAPAIHYADAGVPVAPRVAADWAREAGALSGPARDFYLDGGAPPRMGQMFRSPRLAEVLRLIAADGRAGFYDGPVAEDLSSGLQALGGVHSAADFSDTASTEADPIASAYGGVELIELPPNGQGATANLMLNILSHFDLGRLDPLGADRAHLEAQAARLAYDARDRFIADADHTDRLAHMLSPDTASRLAALIDPRRAMPAPTASAGAVHSDTVYLCVVDADRMAVSLIYSIYHAFGAGFASPRYGILYQNRGAGFTLERGHPNEAGGHKRPMHTIIPAMLRTNGRVTMPFGVMGGAYQPCGHARLVSNLVDFGMELQEAVDAPRSFAAPGGGLELERGYDGAVKQSLTDMGHSTGWRPEPLGGAQCIRMDHTLGVLEGASDPRKDGCALGY